MGGKAMRLWHYELIPYLPDSQLVAQWRELNSIFKKEDKHILINYIYEYPREDLCLYADKVMYEMKARGFRIRSLDNYYNYFMGDLSPEVETPFKNHHTDRYLLQCFFNLQEKYDRGQKDFSAIEYQELLRFVSGKLRVDLSDDQHYLYLK